MIAIILAAGYATRLYPLTKNFPKPLLEIGGQTILDHLVDDAPVASREPRPAGLGFGERGIQRLTEPSRTAEQPRQARAVVRCRESRLRKWCRCPCKVLRSFTPPPGASGSPAAKQASKRLIKLDHLLLLLSLLARKKK